jgi:predicted 2-oxoglutarate/Fe(II)-dependent dioxygenase YbiX
MNLSDAKSLSKKMSFHVKDYVKLYKDVFDREFCQDMINKIEESSWQKHGYYHSHKGTNITFDDDFDVTMSDSEQKNTLQNKLWFLIEDYILKEHAHVNEWFNSWSGYSQVRFNRYSQDTKMRLHCDHIQSIFDGQRKGVPILTILGALNDDYEGGELIMWEDEQIIIPPGSVIIFPSNFLYPHKVMPVTKGTRYSYVSWVW